MLCQNLRLGLNLGCVALLALSVGACGDDNKDDAADGFTSAETGESGGASETGGEGVDGDGDGDPGDGDGDTGDGDGDTGDGDGDTGDGDGDGDGDTGNLGCVDLETEAECDDAPDCQSVIGQPLKQNGPDAPCLEPSEYLGCIPTMNCDDAETWFCVGGNAKPNLVSNGCGPDNGEACDPPAGDPFDACP